MGANLPPSERESPIRTLIYGNDEMLLETRRLLLEKAGLVVKTTMELAEAIGILDAGQIDVGIFCQTLSASECDEVLRVAHDRRPEMKCLVLAPLHSGCADNADASDQVLEQFAYPTSLIAAVRRLALDGTGSTGDPK